MKFSIDTDIGDYDSKRYLKIYLIDNNYRKTYNRMVG